MNFTPGQRWISETEPELGLGLVVRTEGRQVMIRYPAADEERRYAMAGAPLKRVRFHTGEKIRSMDGCTLTIERVETSGDLLVYHGKQGSIPEANLQDQSSSDRPEERFLTGAIDPPEAFRLRLETLNRRFALQKSPIRGFVGGKLDLIPHQFYIAREIGRRLHPRVLLADEVGLGKTIEACLVIHQRLTTGSTKRILILVPRALVHQWFVELLRRFHLSFSLFDEERCTAIESGEPGVNPFLDEQTVIAPLDWLAENPARAVQAVEAGWDLVTVDEAHHLEWSPEGSSPAYRLVEALAQSVSGLLLLTATPEQTGLAGHFARLHLLDPERFPDLPGFLEEHKQWVNTAREAELALASGQEERLRDLLDRHGPGRVIFRNTRAAMSGFPRRHLHPVDLSEGDHSLETWLLEFLRQDPLRKVLVIGGTRKDVNRRYEALRKQTGIPMARFHEEMPLIECDRQAAWFSETDGARLLIASETGGEGRNFQFVQNLVLFDLPEHPEMLEQRIGRLDRIGQKGDIHIYVPYRPDSRDERLLRWLHEGLDAFITPLAGGHMLYLQYRERLDAIDADLLADIRRSKARLQQEIEAGRDRLLELNSNRPEEAQALLEAIRCADQDSDEEQYFLDVLDHCGLHVEGLGGRDYLLLRGHLFSEEFPMPQERMLLTFSRSRALAREDMDFMSMDHPLWLGAMEWLCGSEQGRCSAAFSEKISSPLLHVVFLLEGTAPPETGLGRFLPPTPIDICVDLDGNIHPTPSGDRSPLPPTHFSLLEKLGRDRIQSALAGALRSIEAQSDTYRAEALRSTQELLGGERDRLIRLSEKNQLVHPREIKSMEQQLRQLQEAILQARLRVDSVQMVLPQGSASTRPTAPST